MNILFLNSARRWGGNEKWVYLASGVLSKEHDVYLAYRKEEVGGRFPIEKFKLPFLNEGDLQTIVRLVSIVKEKKIDILIPSKPKDFVLSGLVAKLLGRKNVIRHGLVKDLKNSFIYNIVYDKLADGIIVNAQMIKKVLLKSRYMKPEKIRVIYNGLNVEEIEEQLAADKRIEKPFGFTVCTVGELTERKGVTDLLRGFAGFLQQSKAKDAGFVFIGEGEKKQKQLVDLADRLNVRDNILFTGFLKNPYPYISASDVYVANSKNEGISNALLEAMYLKKAVITTDAGGTEEFIRHRHNGLLIQREAPEELAESLSMLYRNKKLRERLAEEGRRTIMEKFSLARMKEEIISFCEELMDGRNT